MSLPAPIQKAIDVAGVIYDSPYTKFLLNMYSVYTLGKVMMDINKSKWHNVAIAGTVLSRFGSWMVAANTPVDTPHSEPKFDKIDGFNHLNGLNGMNTKVIGYSVLGVAAAGLVGTGIYMWVQHNKDKETQKKLAEQTNEKINSQSLPQNAQSQLPQQIIAPAPLPVQQNTPKPTPAPTPVQTPKSFSFDTKLIYPWKQELAEVTALQAYLNSKGYNAGKIDGKLGAGTMAAVARAMGIAIPKAFSGSLREILAKAEQNTMYLPIAAQNKISLNDFNNFFNPPQNVNMNTTWGSGIFSNGIKGFDYISSVGI